MSNHVRNSMPQLHVGRAQARVGPLTLFPIWTDAPLASERRYRLPETGSVGLVAEKEDGPAVEELVVENDAADPLLILEGMTLDGGWQHRVLTTSILVAPYRRTPIPVRCIEQSRWHGQRHQSFSGFDAPLRMRSTLRRLDVEHGRVAGAAPDQGRVWARVADYERRSGMTNATHSLHEMQGTAAARLRGALAGVAPLPAQRGVIVAVLGHPVLAEVADHPDTLVQRWDALLTGLALDAADAPFMPTPAYRARAFAHRIVTAPLTAFADAGIGTSLVADDHDLVSLRGVADRSGMLHSIVLNTRHELVLAA